MIFNKMFALKYIFIFFVIELSSPLPNGFLPVIDKNAEDQLIKDVNNEFSQYVLPEYVQKQEDLTKQRNRQEIDDYFNTQDYDADKNEQDTMLKDFLLVYSTNDSIQQKSQVDDEREKFIGDLHSKMMEDLQKVYNRENNFRIKQVDTEKDAQNEETVKTQDLNEVTKSSTNITYNLPPIINNEISGVSLNSDEKTGLHKLLTDILLKKRIKIKIDIDIE